MKVVELNLEELESLKGMISKRKSYVKIDDANYCLYLLRVNGKYYSLNKKGVSYYEELLDSKNVIKDEEEIRKFFRDKEGIYLLKVCSGKEFLKKYKVSKEIDF